MRLGEEEHKTKIRKKQKDPVWDEEFVFPLKFGAEAGGALKVTLLDWEMMRNDRPVVSSRAEKLHIPSGTQYLAHIHSSLPSAKKLSCVTFRVA